MGVDGLLARAITAVSKDSLKPALEELFDELITENGPALIRMAGAFTNTTADRDDLFQDIVLAVWRALPNFRGESSARTYLFRIAHNRAMAYLVSRRMMHTATDEAWSLPDPRPDPERQLGAEEQRQTLLEAVRRLPLPYRDVITLVLEGLSYREIADVLGVSEANVGARLNRGRAALRAALGRHV